MIKKLLSLIICLLFLAVLYCRAQEIPGIDAYQAESDGYFMHPSMTSKGVVLTDNYGSKIYLIKNAALSELVSAPGCGMYFNVSPDKTAIGFKLIKPDGMQVPAIYDLEKMKVVELTGPVDLCGQVSFSNNGKIAFTIGNDLHVLSDGNTQIFNLGIYSNIAPVSPDGNYVVFNDDHDQLHIIDITTGHTEHITDNTSGCIYPQWSPDGRKVLYSSLSGVLMVWNRLTKTTYTVGKGEKASWSPDSQFILYDVVTSDNFEFKGSELYLAKFDGSHVYRLTSTPAINEMCPGFTSQNTIVYSTYNDREIVSATVNTGFTGLSDQSLLVKSVLPISFDKTRLDDFLQKKSKAITMVQGDVPYVHQVYDTPNWHWGYWSCAPTTSIMAIAYYNRVPPWDITCSSPSPHVSHYGAYVADQYHFDEVFYNTQATDNAGTAAYGGYGYMWNGSNGPYNKMSPYIQNHGITAGLSDVTDFTTVISDINNSYPYPICSTITSAGHLTLAVGYVVNQHTLIFNDPYGNKNNGYMNYYGKNAYYDWPGYNNGYCNLNTAAWTVKSESSQPSYNDTIIDDEYYNHGFYLYNQGVAKMSYYFDSKTGGYNGHFWYTYTSVNTAADTNYVTWTPGLNTSNTYEVFAYIPNSTIVTATNACYKVYYTGGNTTVVVNQATHRGQWVSLGTFPFSPVNQIYVRLGDGTGIAYQKIAFDAVKWVKVGPFDNIAPTTVTNVSGSWQTQDFVSNFTDADNQGGSGIDKSYYQVLDFDGAEWHANAQRGFFADNFDSYNSSVWSVPANSGTWEVNSGNLVQKDTVSANTNIYAYLNQTLSNRYLYQFNVKIDPATYGTNQHRFGLHYFCDSGSMSNRGNSYFIYFRQETSTLEFFKVVDDIYTQEKVINNVATVFGQCYDIKVVFDRTTGKTDVYRNDVLLGSWTDPNPLSLNNGRYISFRTGNSKMLINEIKVFRTRYPSVTVTVGDSANKDIRYQNPDPSTPAAKIKSIVNDAVGNLSAIDYYNLNVDWTPPACVSVNDGTDADIDITLSTNTLSANWTASSDSNSGISKYLYAIGTAPWSTDVVGWTGNGLSTSITKTGLSLTNMQTYYFSIQAINGAELTSTCCSDGILVNTDTDVDEPVESRVISLSPNPFDKSFTLQFYVNHEQRVIISLTDILGRETIIANKMFSEGSHDILIAADEYGLSKGIYVLGLFTEKAYNSVPIIKYQ